jgi:hypothetical protein
MLKSMLIKSDAPVVPSGHKIDITQLTTILIPLQGTVFAFYIQRKLIAQKSQRKF